MSFYRIRPRSGTATQWKTANTVLGEREIGYEVPDDGVGTGVVKMKMGNGTTPWNDLPYAIPIALTQDDIVDNATTDDSTKAVSASVVKEMNDSLDRVWEHINKIINNMSTSGNTPTIEYGTESVDEIPANSYLDVTITFSSMFKTNNISCVTSLNVASGASPNWGNVEPVIRSISANSCVCRIYNANSSAFTPTGLNWIVCGVKNPLYDVMG